VMFWSNKVLKKYKDNDQDHCDWTKALINMCNELQKYVKQHHTTGVNWSKSGGPATLEQLKQKPGTKPKPGSGASAAGGPPPPPAGPPAGPPPPPPAGDAPVPSANQTQTASSALFSQINDLGSGGITSHLKSVPRDPVTGKRIKTKEGVSKENLEVKPLKEKATPKPAQKQVAVKKPPKFELLGGKKWIVEYQENNNDLVIDDATMRMTVYVFKCEKCTIQVHGKCNSITLDSCKKVNLVFDNAVAGVDVVNCQSVKCQVIGSVPNIQVDKTDGFHMYLSKESQNCQFITAKSSEMNISVVKDDDDFMEVPIPEQFKTVWCDKINGFTTVPNDN
jgi:adenylyl cyclase-associated protein